MDENICLHGIYAKSDYYHEIKTEYYLEQILKSKALLSRRLLNDKRESCFNGLDYISLCDYSKRNNHFLGEINSFEAYIKYSLSLMFPKEKLTLIIPEMIDITSRGDYYTNMKILGLTSTKRYSDMADEVQVKDSISLDLMTGITMPIDKMINQSLNSEKNINNILKQIKQIIITLDKYNYLVPLYDINTFERIDNESNVKYLIKHK